MSLENPTLRFRGSTRRQPTAPTDRRRELHLADSPEPLRLGPDPGPALDRTLRAASLRPLVRGRYGLGQRRREGPP